MTEIAIKAENISKTFSYQMKSLSKIFSKNSRNNKFLVLDDISFEVPVGKMYAIMGLNGSGKTTLLRILAGIYKPDSGSVTINGKLAPILHTGTGFNDEFTAKDNIVTSGIVLGMKKEEVLGKVNKIIKFAELQKFTNQQIKHYSSGMKARLACSIALEINPDILLMDEILSTGDIKFKEKSFKAFLRFKEKGKTILYTTHSIGMVKKLAEKVILLDKGRIVTIDEPEVVLSKYKELSNEKREKN